MSAAARIEAAALAAVGVRFRLHGRDEQGLDCVGLVALALAAGGVAVAVPTGYRLRGGDPARVADVLDGAMVRAAVPAPGCVLLMRTGPGQLHLGIGVAGGLVHADAGLGRVVLRPGEPPWPVLAIWTMEAS